MSQVFSLVFVVAFTFLVALSNVILIAEIVSSEQIISSVSEDASKYGYVEACNIISSAENPDDGIGIFEYDVPAGYRALCTTSLNATEYS